jgi:hypothetical protein
MIKWAEYFGSKNRESRNRDMIFAFCIGHDSFDNNSGHYQFAERHKDRLTKAIVWDVDHSAGGTRYVEIEGELQPTSETSELYTIADNYTFARLASFYLDKYGFVNTIDQFRSPGGGPNWGIAPTNSPWVNSASITRFYHSTLDTPEKITVAQLKRAYAAHIEILEAVDRTPEGFLRYDTVDKTRPNTPPKVRISVLSDTVGVGDTGWRMMICSSTMTRLVIVIREYLNGHVSNGIGEMAPSPLVQGHRLITFTHILESIPSP